MQEMAFHVKELLFAAAQVGAEKFYGLADPFYGMTQDQLYSEIPRIQTALEQRGYAEMGFDGAFTLKEEVRELIAPCALCRRYVLLRSLSGGKERLMLVYADECKLVEVIAQSENVTLRPVAAREIPARILQSMHLSASDVADVATTKLWQADLAGIQPLAIEEPAMANDKLQELGCSPEMADLLVKGFRYEATFHTLIRTDLEKRTLDQAILIQNGTAVVFLTLEDVDENIWKAAFLPDGIDLAELKMLCDLEENHI